MSILIWGTAAIIGGLLVIVLGARALGRPHDGPRLDERLPPTPLQRIARRGLGLGGALTAVLVAYVLYFGPERVQQDDPLRIGFTLLLVAILIVFWSCLVVSLLAFPLGILVGYRRS